MREFRTGITKGAASEMLVCADLLSRGFDVYRAIAGNAVCDLVAVKGESITRIEVKSFPIYKNGPGVDVVAWPDRGSIRYYGIECELTASTGGVERVPIRKPLQAEPVKTEDDSVPYIQDVVGWIPKRDAADALGVSTKTIEKYVQQGRLRQMMCRQHLKPNIAVIEASGINGFKKAATATA